MARNFVAYLTLTSCLVAGQSPKYGLNGQKVNLVPEIIGQPNSILWTHNGNKVVEFNGREQEEYSSHKNRITLDWHSAELMIANLRFEDSGDYDLERDVNKELRHSHFKLEVIDNVAKPTISCKMNDDGVSGELMCSAEPRRPESLMKFEWNSGGAVLPGPKLTISLGEKHDAEVHSCRVSNPLSREMATVMAKDCYTDDSSSGALIACLVMSMLLLLIAAIVAIVAIVLCKRHHKACFAKGKTGVLENPTTGGSDEKTESEEHPFLVKKASTPPSTQPLRLTQGSVRGKVTYYEKIQRTKNSSTKKNPGSDKAADDDEEAQDEKSAPASAETSPTAQPRSPLTKSSPNTPPEDTGGDHKEEPESEQAPGGTDSSGITQKRNESGDSTVEVQSSTVPEEPTSLPESPSPTTPDNNNTKPIQGTPDTAHADPDQEEGSDEKTESEEHPFLVEKASTPPPTQPLRVTQGLVQKRRQQFEPGKVQRESDSDEDEEAKSPPANGFSPPTAQPHSLLTRSSPNMAPKDTAGEHKEDANSDQVTGETSDDNFREADSSGIGKSNESDDSNKDTQSLIVPEQNGSETSRDDQDLNLYQGETHTGDDNQQELDKPVSAVEDEPEENDKNQNLATPLLHQCPSPTTPDNRNTNTFQETPDTAHPDPDQEEGGKTSQGSEGQSDSSTAEADKSEGETAENEEQCDPKEEKKEEH